MKNDKLEATKKLNLILVQTRKILKVNKEQTQQKILFDMLSAVEEASFLLKEAWEISLLHNLADDHLRQDFTEMFSEFGELRKNLNQDLKYKH